MHEKVEENNVVFSEESLIETESESESSSEEDSESIEDEEYQIDLN